MKRLYISLLILTSIIISSLFFNNKINCKSEELIMLTESNSTSEDIYYWWSKNRIWFDMIISEELKEDIETNILLYHNTNTDEQIKVQIKIGAQKILDSTELTISNIF